MIAEILATGDEVRTGTIVDTNSGHIARVLEENGVRVTRHGCVGDDLELLVSVFREIGNRSDVAVVTGGLGPTSDDLSAQAAARAVSVDLVLDETALAWIESYFKSRGRTMNPSNRKQAYFPQGAEILPNPMGTAPGFCLKIGRCVFFFLPGVPHEMKRMLSEQVLSRIEKLKGGKKRLCLVRTVSTFGLTESATGDKLASFSEAFSDVKLGFRVKFPEIHVRLYGYGEDERGLENRLERAVQWVSEKLEGRVLSLSGESLEEVVGTLLRKRGETLAVAESCTGGFIAHSLTEVPGSSDYFLFSGVTYANEAKTKLLGVSQETLKQFGAVSEQTAKEMAEGARKVTGATWGLSTSGIAGPAGGSPEKPVGTVCIGLAASGGSMGFRYTLDFGRRSMNKILFAATALDVLRRELLK